MGRASHAPTSIRKASTFRDPITLLNTKLDVNGIPSSRLVAATILGRCDEGWHSHLGVWLMAGACFI